MTKLITYGTLKSGFINEPLLSNEKFLGKAVLTESKFLLYEIHGNYAFPALVESKSGVGYQVYGELYEVSERCLEYLDMIEGVSHGLYARTPVKVLCEDGQEVEAIAYCFLRSTADLKSVGPVWPISELPRYQLVGHRLEEEDKEIEFDGVALFNIKLNECVTPTEANETELRKRCMPRRGKYGVLHISMEPWVSKWFEPRPKKDKKTVKVCRLRSGKNSSPDFHSKAECATWAADNLKFFGGVSGSAAEWRKVISEVYQNIDGE